MERQHKLQTAVCLNRIESRADVVVTDDHTVQIGTEHYSGTVAFVRPGIVLPLHLPVVFAWFVLQRAHGHLSN